jgi:hypothetical protein
VVRQLQRTKIRQLRMGDEEVEWVSKEVSSGGNCKGLRRPQCICWILFGHFRKSSRSGSIRKSHPLWEHCCSLPKKMLWEQGNTIEPCRHWLCDEMEKIYCCMHHLCRFQSPPLFTSRVRVRCCRVNFPRTLSFFLCISSHFSPSTFFV